MNFTFAHNNLNVYDLDDIFRLFIYNFVVV